ncbi:hypothetical protein [Porticoccus sp.]
MENERKACEIAKALLQSDSEYLDKVLHLNALGNSIHGQVWDTEFHVFGVIASDTDHLPTENVRQFCSENMLKNSDSEIEETIKFYKPQVVNACNAILSKYQNV